MQRVGKKHAEEFSFALSVILTPAVIGKELLRLMKAHPASRAPPCTWARCWRPA